MYGWIWRHLPGPKVLRALFLLIVAAGILAACFMWVFPWLAPYMPFNDVTLEE